MYWNVFKVLSLPRLVPHFCFLIHGLMLLQVFAILVQGLFDPTQHLPAETQRTYVQLLATAAAAVDDRSAHAFFDIHDAVTSLQRC